MVRQVFRFIGLGAAVAFVVMAAGFSGHVGWAQSQPQPPAGMVLIQAGPSFQMGDSFNEGIPDERPVHAVSVSAFYMDVNDVTVWLWNQVATWAASHGYDLTTRSDQYNPGDKYPVTSVSWYEAVKWANARSEMENKTPAYYTDSAQTTVYRTGNVDLMNDDVNWGTNVGYRLPTEAEWEKAARGGLSGMRYPWGNGISCTEANYSFYPGLPPCVGHTTPVGSYPANGYMLYDMAGNVYQWVWDRYGSSYYANSPSTDPRGPASGTSRVFRGGSWSSNYVGGCRVAYRADHSPGDSYADVGFRLVRTAP